MSNAEVFTSLFYIRYSAFNIFIRSQTADFTFHPAKDFTVAQVGEPSLAVPGTWASNTSSGFAAA